MFLSVKELELRKISFDKLFEPGQIEFTGEDLEQSSPLHAIGSAELLPESGEAEIDFYEDGLELEDILREQVLLALPMQRVCSETCKGICPSCGKNRNETACDCKPVVDDRWAALRNLEL